MYLIQQLRFNVQFLTKSIDLIIGSLQFYVKALILISFSFHFKYIYSNRSLVSIFTVLNTSI